MIPKILIFIHYFQYFISLSILIYYLLSTFKKIFISLSTLYSFKLIQIHLKYSVKQIMLISLQLLLQILQSKKRFLFFISINFIYFYISPYLGDSLYNIQFIYYIMDNQLRNIYLFLCLEEYISRNRFPSITLHVTYEIRRSL